jgi:cytidylate kinase
LLNERGFSDALRKPPPVSLAQPFQVAIDGPAASGKTTVARLLARRLHALYFDTGAMYRALAYEALQTRTDVDNGAALARLLARHPLAVELDEAAPLGFRIATAEGHEFTEAMLQSNEVTAIVSTVAAHPEVRAAMVAAQRAVAAEYPVVMAGRDIGTVVLPTAAVKIYLTASVPARVMRRRAQLSQAGVDVAAHQLRQEIEERDRLDRTRAISPLEPAAGAYTIDSSDLSASEVVAEICAIVQRVEPAP